MYDKDKLLEIIKANEEIARKFFEIEVGILSTCDFKDLFEKLLLFIEEKFGIPHVWISIINGQDVSDLVQALESSHVVKERLNLVERSVFLELLKDERTPILVNENLRPYYRLLPENQKYFVKSLAIAPLVLEGNVIGSLNLGDYSGLRFEPSMDTFFLSQLAVKVSICLSNVNAREKLKYLATRDPLTSLLNRREMEDLLEGEFSRAIRYGTPLALLFVDCDDFKTVNDSYGHNCGDALLRYLATHMLKIVRRDDRVFRFAGDEFVVLLPNQTFDKARRVLDRLHAFVEENPLNFGDVSIRFSISCGIASTQDPEVTGPAALLKKADERLYEAKKQKGLSSSK
jgi:diguanylate cyclase (GGDEF)-like protein